MRSRRCLSLLFALFVAVVFGAWACDAGDDDDSGESSDDDFGDTAGAIVLVVPENAGSVIDMAARDARALLARSAWRLGDEAVVIANELPATAASLIVILEDPNAPDSAFTSVELRELGSEAYRIRRSDTELGPTVVIAGGDAGGVQFGLYRLLEILGMRFFHPEQDHVPEFEGKIPEALDLVESPSYARRGFHIHTMHPIEATEFLQRDRPDYLEYAKRLIDWHVRNRQNYMQWELLRTVDFEATEDHFRAIVDYAHARGMKIGIVVTWVFQQQKAWKIVPWFGCECREEMEANIDRLMRVPWDHINLEMGTSEFTPTNDELQVAWMDNTVAYLAERYPGTDASVKVHVSSGQHSDTYGVNFNFLPQFADPRMGVYPHTVQFYDLLGPAPTYENDSFRFMYEWMLDRVGERKVYYYPETAYWVSFDIDVPLFLPVYILNRWRDIRLLADENIDGHVTFTSGHEWGYWLSDWAVARMTFDASADLSDVLSEFTGIFGNDAGAMTTALLDLISLEEHALINQEMVSYLTGQDTFDEIGYLLGSATQPQPVMFSEIDAMDAGALAEFETETLADLGAMAVRFDAVADDVESLGTGVPDDSRAWFDEMRDAFRVNALRAGHSYALYAGAIARRRAEIGLDSGGETVALRHFDTALATTDEFLDLMRRREAHYRYPISLSSSWERSLTSYDFRYLWQASTAYWYRRAEKQAIDREFSPFLMNVIDPFWFIF
ncbi:MAG: hypothetical protein IT350_06905 [Deltaproteobacteria bacterium]|nr:hypothetical protein [Deltaproteobacteria bacterium]